MNKRATYLQQTDKHTTANCGRTNFVEITPFYLLFSGHAKELSLNGVTRILASGLCLLNVNGAEVLPVLPDLLVELSTVIPIRQHADIPYGLLFILALSSLSVYSLIIAGGASNSKYAFLGSLRSAAQMISYEVSISLVLIPVIFLAGTLNFTGIVHAQINTVGFVFPLLPLAIIFFISMIAETNRTPFDLPEAEAELVAGYNVEYSSIIFAMFFLAEYGNMILMSVINVELFFGGGGAGDSNIYLVGKTLVFCFLFVLVRATFPRYRYDQLMDIGGKIFLPTATGLLLVIVSVVMIADAVPITTALTIRPFTEPQLG